MFLKDRGDAMHRSGNYRAAINAYTKAVEIDGTLSVCYANRAASHLKMQEYRQATKLPYGTKLTFQVDHANLPPAERKHTCTVAH